MLEFTITKEEELTLGNFEAWAGAVNVLNKIIELDLEEAASEYIQMCLGDTINETELNDFIWFEMEDFLEEYGAWED